MTSISALQSTATRFQNNEVFEESSLQEMQEKVKRLEKVIERMKKDKHEFLEKMKATLDDFPLLCFKPLQI